VELGAASLLHTAAHQQLVVAPVDRQHLVEVVRVHEGAVGVRVAGAAACSALVRVEQGAGGHLVAGPEGLVKLVENVASSQVDRAPVDGDMYEVEKARVLELRHQSSERGGELEEGE